MIKSFSNVHKPISVSSSVILLVLTRFFNVAKSSYVDGAISLNILSLIFVISNADTEFPKQE